MFVRERLFVEFEGVVGVREVLLGFLLYLRVCRNLVKKFSAVARVFSVSCLIRLESFIMAHFFFLCIPVTSAERPRKVITANEATELMTAPPTIIAILAMTVIAFRFFSKSVLPKKHKLWFHRDCAHLRKNLGHTTRKAFKKLIKSKKSKHLLKFPN